MNAIGHIGLPPPSAIALFGMIVEARKNDARYRIDTEVLAQKVGITRGPINRDLLELENHGYIKRTGSGPRKRWGSAEITEAGREFAESGGCELVQGRVYAQRMTTSGKNRQRKRRLVRNTYRVEGVTYELTGRQERAFFGIRDYCTERPGAFPTTNELVVYLGDKLTSHTRGHMVTLFRNLETMGLIERVGDKQVMQWNLYGRFTKAGEAFIAAHPDTTSAYTPQQMRFGGGVHPKTGGTRFEQMLVSVGNLTAEEIAPLADPYGKLGRKVDKAGKAGLQKGLPIRTFTLEEGKTCDLQCGMRNYCYGGKMSRQKRIRYEGQKTDIAVAQAIMEVGPAHYRLTTLGDIPNREFLEGLIAALVVTKSTAFGYSHWHPGSELGAQIYAYADRYWEWFSVRFSYETGVEKPPVERGAVTLPEFDEGLLRYHNAIPCPQQQGKALDCGDCGLCWTTRQNIAFKLH